MAQGSAVRQAGTTSNAAKTQRLNALFGDQLDGDLDEMVPGRCGAGASILRCHVDSVYNYVDTVNIGIADSWDSQPR